MDFRENRLVFQEVPDGVPAGDAATGSGGESPPDDLEGDEVPSREPDFTVSGQDGYEYKNDESIVGFETNDVRRQEKADAPGTYIYEIYNGENWVSFEPTWIAAPVAAEKKAEVADDAQTARVKLDTSISLSGLREGMGRYFQDVINILKDKKMAGGIKFGQLTPEFLFIGGEDAFKAAVIQQLTEADMAALKTAVGQVYELNGVDFSEFLPKVAAVATIGIFKSTIEARYPHILTFDKFKYGIVDLKYELRLDGENPILDLSLSDPAAQSLYDTHAADEQKKVEETTRQQQEAATQETQAQTLAKDKKAFKDQLRETAIGTFLVDFFDGPGLDGKPGLIDKLFEGKSPILAFLLGALGVGKFKEDYDKVRRLADKNPKLKGLLDQVDERVKPYRVDTPETAETAAAAAAEAPGFTPIGGDIDGRRFTIEVGEKRVVGDQGLKLVDHAYTIPTGKKLRVDLINGGSIILPQGQAAALNIEGENDPDRGGDDRTFKNVQLVLVKAIPKETIFTKGAKLELVSV